MNATAIKTKQMDGVVKTNFNLRYAHTTNEYHGGRPKRGHNTQLPSDFGPVRGIFGSTGWLMPPPETSTDQLVNYRDPGVAGGLYVNAHMYAYKHTRAHISTTRAPARVHIHIGTSLTTGMASP